MRLVTKLLILAACGSATTCSDPVRDAEDRLAIVEKAGSLRDICTAHRALSEALLQAKDAVRYKEQRLAADVHCAVSGRGAADALVYANSATTADNMDVTADE